MTAMLVDDTAAAAPPPKTLAELLRIHPTAAQVDQSITTLLADLIYWAGLSGVQFTPTPVKALMQVRSPLISATRKILSTVAVI